MSLSVVDDTTQYDIFISYRFTQHDWAEALAHNLVAQGYKVFLDAWELYGGQNFTRVIENALKNSRCAILIATPEAADSGWVQSEYESMFNREQKQDGFFFVPVVCGTFLDFPFLDVKQAVNFQQSTAAQYREGFLCLFCAYCEHKWINTFILLSQLFSMLFFIFMLVFFYCLLDVFHLPCIDQALLYCRNYFYVI